MRKLSLYLAFAMIALASPSVAQESVFDWSGGYVGVHLGGASSDNGFYIQGAEVTSDHSGSGVIGGGQIGWNFQQGSWMFGAVADISASGVDGSTDCPNEAFTCATELDWLASARLRAGYAVGNLLVYGTGGLGFGRVDASAIRKDGTVVYNDDASTETGWAAGAGAEFAFAPNWSLSGEYLYVDLGGTDMEFGNPTHLDTELSTGRIGLNYHW